MADSPHSDARRPAREQERRATEAINAIFSGADLTEETLTLSNEFTDRHEARLKAWITRKHRTGE